MINKNQPDTTLPKTPKVKIYHALISQTGTAAPTVIILLNTLGTITWGRTSAGIYTGECIGAFTENKTSIIMGQRVGGMTMIRTDDDEVGIQTFDLTNANSDNILFETTIQINVYE